MGIYVPADPSDYGADVVYDKIIRDGVVDKLLRLGNKVEYETITDNSQIVEALLRKIHEEADEYSQATPEKRPGELADILELVRSIAKRESIDMREVEEIMEDKLTKEGGYEKGTILKRVTKGDVK